MAKKGKTTEAVDTKWIIRVIIVITILSIGLFIYFNHKVRERYERTSAQREAELAEEASKVSLTCSGLLPLTNGNYALYGDSKITDFNVNSEGTLVDTNSLTLSTSLNTGGATDFYVKALSATGIETNLLEGNTVLYFSYSDEMKSAAGKFSVTESGLAFDELTLPTAPAGYRYAAWIVNDDGLFLVDRFSSANGEISKELDTVLIGGDAVVGVTLEPIWYETDIPFPITVLSGEIPEGIGIGESIEMDLALDSLPYCVVE